MRHIGWFLAVWNAAIIAWIVYSIKNGSVREIKQRLRAADKHGFGDQLRKDLAEFLRNPETRGENVPQFVRHRCWAYQNEISEKRRKAREQQSLAQREEKRRKQQQQETLRAAAQGEKNMRRYGSFIVKQTAEDRQHGNAIEWPSSK